MPNRVPYARPVPEGLTPARPDARAKAEAKQERDSFYNRARWIAFRKWFLARHPVCLDCLDAGTVTPATIPHHIEERLARPDLAFTESNLRALCGPCHTRRHKGKGQA